jgi:hypothetical protein
MNIIKKLISRNQKGKPLANDNWAIAKKENKTNLNIIFQNIIYLDVLANTSYFNFLFLKKRSIFFLRKNFARRTSLKFLPVGKTKQF